MCPVSCRRAAALGLAAYGVSRAPTSPASAAPAGRVTSAFASIPLTVPAGENAAPLDQRRTLRLPTGWTAAVWARIPDARPEAWTPKRDLLVSSPQSGTWSS